MRGFIKRGAVCVLTAAVAISGIVITNEKNVKTVEAASSDYQLLWSEEFDGTALNRDVWNVEVNGNGGGNNELQYYLDDPDNIEVSNGTLKINALKESYGGKNYTSGRINTRNKQTFQFGRLEARIKLPSFTGSWPAFWTLGQSYGSVGWPRCGEIDILEAINTENYTHGAVHWYVESADYNGQGDVEKNSLSVLPSNYKRTDWHTYGIEWTETTIDFYVDNKVFYSQPITESHMDEFRKEQFVILNLAIGGNWPGFTIDNSAFPDKSTMEVDYVRYYGEPQAPKVEVEQDLVATTDSPWTYYFGSDWAGAQGTMTGGATTPDGFTIDVTKRGAGDRWAIQGGLAGLVVVPGEKYTFNCTVTSDVKKEIFIKVSQENDGEINGDYIILEPGVPYNYSVEFTVPEDYNGTIKIVYGMGACDDDGIGENDAFKLSVTDVSLIGLTLIPDPDYEVPTTNPQEPTTEKPSEKPTEKPTGKPTIEPSTETPTTVTPAIKVKKGKVVKTKRTSKKKAKVTFKAVKGADGYYIRYSRKKKVTTKNSKLVKIKVGTKTSKKIKGLKAGKRYYVKVRAYKIVNGVRVKGKWSKARMIKAKVGNTWKLKK